MMNFLAGEYKKGTIAPTQGDIFRAFRMTPYDKVKVVIVGQDPYPTFTNGMPDATGLAFANRKDVLSLSPSLRMIRNAVENNMDALHLDFDVSLEKWAKQGVLLLNTALTINIYRRNLHKPLWEKFTRGILYNLDINKQDLHFVFWGKDAQRFNNINGLFHNTYEYMHPTAAVYKNNQWDCKHFEQINNNLTYDKQETIKW